MKCLLIKPFIRISSPEHHSIVTSRVLLGGVIAQLIIHLARFHLSSRPSELIRRHTFVSLLNLSRQPLNFPESWSFDLLGFGLVVSHDPRGPLPAILRVTLAGWVHLGCITLGSGGGACELFKMPSLDLELPRSWIFDGLFLRYGIMCNDLKLRHSDPELVRIRELVGVPWGTFEISHCLGVPTHPFGYAFR